MADVRTNRYYINGKDFYTIFSVVVEKGSEGFLKYPSRKDSITRDWSNENGLDVDTKYNYFTTRDITLDCAVIVTDESQFWDKYKAFIAEWMKEGKKRIQVGEFGFRSFYCVYKETSNFQRYSRIVGTNEIACKFSITFTEVEPTFDTKDVFIVDEEDRFLITP